MGTTDKEFYEMRWVHRDKARTLPIGQNTLEGIEKIEQLFNSSDEK